MGACQVTKEPQPTEVAPPLTHRETLAAIRGYFRGERIDQIEVAISALHWLERLPVATAPDEAGYSQRQLIGALAAWLANDDPWLPELLVDAAYDWLQRAEQRQ